MKAHSISASDLERLSDFAADFQSRHDDAKKYIDALESLKRAAETIGESFSQSWLGYHASVYYGDLTVPPPGAHFSQEWGLERLFSGLGTQGDWREYAYNDVIIAVRAQAGNPNLRDAQKYYDDLRLAFIDAKQEANSIFENNLTDAPDAYIAALKKDLENMKIFSKTEVLNIHKPSGEIMSRDMIAISQRTRVPPHWEILSEVLAIRNAIGVSKNASRLFSKAAAYYARKGSSMSGASERTRVCIGHGRSKLWLEFKDFLEKRLLVPWDEFNRISVAGQSTIDRLKEMLDSATIAFIIMTAEDEMSDGKVIARLNVVHEAGLFQGRLGFRKAIVLLEDGCDEFSNIHGLGQIRFPKGNIRGAFEDVRLVLEREGVLR